MDGPREGQGGVMCHSARIGFSPLGPTSAMVRLTSAGFKLRKCQAGES